MDALFGLPPDLDCSPACMLVRSVLAGAAAHADSRQILGVAGRMVRTRGPWRCVFSNGREPLSSAATAGPGAEEKQKVETPAGASILAGTGARRGDSSSGIVSSNGHTNDAASSGDAQDGRRTAASGGDGGGCVVDCGGGGGNDSTGVGDGEMDVVPAEALRKGGLVYLNTATGETVREPPAELVSRAEEADSAGEYLVFVPSRSFVEAAEAAAGLSAAASAVGAAAENALRAVADAGTSSSASGGDDCAGRNGTVADKRRREEEEGSQQRARLPSSLEAPTPPTAATPAAVGSDQSGGGGGGNGATWGGETWDRLSSLPMIDLSQGAAPSAPLDVENTGVCGGGGSGAGSEAAGAVAVAGATAGTWTCTRCTLVNRASRTTCEVCANARPKSFGAQQVRVENERGDEGTGVGKLILACFLCLLA